MWIKPVRTPFIYITRHVIQSWRIWTVTAHGHCGFSINSTYPISRFIEVGSCKIYPLRVGNIFPIPKSDIPPTFSGCILPFSFWRETYCMTGLVCHPITKGPGIIPAHTDNRTVTSTPVYIIRFNSACCITKGIILGKRNLIFTYVKIGYGNLMRGVSLHHPSPNWSPIWKVPPFTNTQSISIWLKLSPTPMMIVQHIAKMLNFRNWWFSIIPSLWIFHSLYLFFQSHVIYKYGKHYTRSIIY